MKHDSPARLGRGLAALLLCAGVPGVAGAATAAHWSCPAEPPLEPLPGVKDLGAATRVTADRMTAQDQALATFLGNVVLLQAGKRVTGDRLDYHRDLGTADVVGNVHFQDGTIDAHGDRGHVELDKDKGELENATYRVPGAHAFGTAKKVEMLDKQHTRLDTATYTTCSPGDVAWQVEASEVKLDKSNNTGEAWHSWIEFKGVPIFYSPYMNFALSGRKSGFLFPTYGSSDQTGTDFALPYYWNIAPNRDATITPRYIQKRGTMLMTEFRYLNPTNYGQVTLDYLPDDSLYGKDRYSIGLKHSAAPAPGWSVNVLYNEVSDKDYFNDLGNSLSTAAQTTLDRHVDVRYTADNWSFSGRVQDYQALDTTKPYQLLPQLRLNAATPLEYGKPRYEFKGEFVNYASKLKTPTGTRLDLSPTVSLPLHGDYWFLTPRTTLRYTQYNLSGATDNSPSRTVPVTSVDSGLYFDREFSFAGRSLQQTLEPRLFYLYAPYHNQDNLPRFDTGTYSFSFDQLFRENRFSGADRVSDANQVTAAVTTRFLDQETGVELLRASIGQIFYFRDRKVFVTETRDHSDMAAELAAHPVPSVNASAAVQWDPDTGETQALSARMEYRPEEGKALSASYNFTNGNPDKSTALVTAFWPITSHWQFIGGYNYDFQRKSPLEQGFGVRYENCCWATHLMIGKRLNTSTLKLEKSIYLTLELRGLSTIGRAPNEEFTDTILGYY